MPNTAPMPVKIPLAKLAAITNPLTDPPWDDCNRRITRAEIKKATGTPLPFRASNSYSHAGLGLVWSRQDHIDRIARLAIDGWERPIHIDSYGCESGRDPVTDGNHRLAAALYRKDSHILAQVSGDLDMALEMFGIDCEE